MSSTAGAAGCSDSLIELDTTHFTTLHPSWVDILAMAGQELFVIDGDSLVSYVLQDSTLQLARKGDPSYQLLHATYLVEHLLHQLIKRDCIFDVVFFKCQCSDTLPLTLFSSSSLCSAQLKYIPR